MKTEPLVVAGLDTALDCDLALCPFTNTMPVLRHDLVAAAQHGGSAAVDLVMAWVSVPDLTVHPSSQRYTVVGPAASGGALIRYTSGTFEATIDFDRDGLVREYPGLGKRIHPRGLTRARGEPGRESGRPRPSYERGHDTEEARCRPTRSTSS